MLETACRNGYKGGKDTPCTTKEVECLYTFARDEFDPEDTVRGRKRRVGSLSWRSVVRMHRKRKKLLMRAV